MAKAHARINPSEEFMKQIAQFLICPLTFLFLFATPLVSADKQQLFSLAIAPSTVTLKSGAELRLRVTVTNTSDRRIGFIRSPAALPEEGLRYNIDVRDPQGQSAPPSASARQLSKNTTVILGSNVARWLNPGESFVDEIDITKLYDLSQPGKYSIAVAREIPPAQNLGKGIVKSNSITVRVVK
jgi:hypothetical protein